MVVGLFVYQQLFSFQIKCFRFAYFVPIQTTLCHLAVEPVQLSP